MLEVDGMLGENYRTSSDWNISFPVNYGEHWGLDLFRQKLRVLLLSDTYQLSENSTYLDHIFTFGPKVHPSLFVGSA